MAPPWVTVPPRAYGGTEAVIDRLARGFQAAGHDVLLWTTGDSTCPVPRDYVLPHAAFGRMGLASIELRHLIRGYEALRNWGADVVHDHTLIGPVYASRFPDLVVATTNHGPFNEDLMDLYKAVSADTAVISISNHQASTAVDVPITAIIHHGLDLEAFPVGDGSGDEQGEYFLFLGRMVPEKGVRRAAVAAKKAGVRLLIAAKMQDPWEYQFFTEQVEPLLSDQVVFLGEVGPTERISLLQGAKGLLNPIRWDEPFGLVMIEALACGTPVLAFRQGSAPEIVDHGVTGFLSDSTPELAEQIPLVATLDRSSCRKAAETRFGTERMVADHLELFERLIASPPGS